MNLEWFTDAKFGMFYHFGLYTLLGGNENKVRSEVSKGEYRKLMDKFEIENFNADEWVDCAVSMGAEYIVPTAKHAEGFCLFDSKLTDLKSTNTPSGRDIIAELATAAEKKGVKFAFYFNLETWLNEGDDIWNKKGMSYADFFEGQLEELLTGYGPVALIWFDHVTKEVPFERMEKIVKKIKLLQPDCLVNNRGIFKSAPRRLGDFITPERHILDVDPAKNFTVECCDAMGVRSWGYCSDESFWSTEELAKRVSNCASKGYNYLLNVEPAPDGSIRQECRERASTLGDWIKTNLNEIKAEPCDIKPADAIMPEPEIGVSTISANTVNLFLHEWPQSDEVLLKVSGDPVSAGMNGGIELQVKKKEQGILLNGLPAVQPNPHGPWIVSVEFKEKPELLPSPPEKTMELLPGESAFLSPLDAQTTFSPNGQRNVGVNRFSDGKISLGSFFFPEDYVSWNVDSPENREFDVYVSLGSIESQSDALFEISTGESSLNERTWLTEHYSKPVRKQVGKICLNEGKNRVIYRVVETPNGSASDIHGIWLIPTQNKND